MQCLQIRRTRRWATTPITELATQVRLDAEVEETRDRARGVVRVQRREDQVARQRRLDGDRRRLDVPDFADEDDVRVLADDGPQAGAERQALLRDSPRSG